MTTATAPTEDDYFRFDDVCANLMQALARTSKPSLRARYLDQLSIYEWRRSELHTAVFGEDPHDTDGTPAAVWLADSARLLRIVAEAEYYRDRRGPADWWGHTDERHRELRAAAEPTLYMWMRIGPPTPRRRLLAELVETWLPLTGGQAVESIACIPFPRWFR